MPGDNDFFRSEERISFFDTPDLFNNPLNSNRRAPGESFLTWVRTAMGLPCRVTTISSGFPRYWVALFLKSRPDVIFMWASNCSYNCSLYFIPFQDVHG